MPVPFWSWPSRVKPVRRRGRRRPAPAPQLEVLEERTLLTGDTFGAALAPGLDPARGAIFGRVFDDHDGDGRQGPGEGGLAGTTVYLDQDRNGVLDPGEPATLTEVNGEYRFTDLDPGTYFVAQEVPAGRRSTFAGSRHALLRADFSDADGNADAEGFSTDGGDSWQLTADRGGDPGHSAGFSFHAGSAGFFGQESRLLSPLIDLSGFTGASLTFTQFLDLGLDFAQVSVVSDTGRTVLASTDANGGLARFTGAFVPARYDLSDFAGRQVQLEFLFAPGFGFGGEGWYVDDVVVSGNIPGARVVDVGAGQAVTGADFGSQQLGEVRGTVFLDADGDGARGPEEPGRQGTTVYLDLNKNDHLDFGEPSTVTGSDGDYRFAGLVPGVYPVAEVVPSGLLQTSPAPVAAAELFRAGFDDGAGGPAGDGFVTDGPDSPWHLSLGHSSDPAHSPPFSFYFGAGEGGDGGGSIVPGTAGTLTSPVIDLGGVRGAVTLEFNQLLSLGGNEVARVSVLADGVETVLADTGDGGLPLAADGFRPVRLDLSAFAGRQVQVRFAFTADSFIPFEGWYVDDVVVRSNAASGRSFVTVGPGTSDTADFGNRPAADLVPLTLTVAPDAARWGDAVTVRYAVRNSGSADAGPFQVELRLTTDSRPGAPSLLLTTPDGGPAVLRLGGLGTGQTATGSLTVVLPLSPPAGVATPQRAFLGLRVDAGNEVVELNEDNNDSRGGTARASLDLLTPVAEQEANDTPDTAQAVPLLASIDGTTTTGDVDYYRVTLPGPGRLVARVTTDGFAARLSLFDADGVRLGAPLVQSDGRSAIDPVPEIIQFLDGDPAGTTYYLAVEGRGGGAGAYGLVVDVTPSLPPFRPLPVDGSRALVADFDGDGRLDVAGTGDGIDSGTLTVFLGNGDGTFRTVAAPTPLGLSTDVLVGDFNADGTPDLVSTQLNRVEVRLGVGDGTFEDPAGMTLTVAPRRLAVGDFNGDGRLDVAVAGPPSLEGGEQVLLLLGNGDGSLTRGGTYAVGGRVAGLATADFNEDGRTDLAVTVESPLNSFLPAPGAVLAGGVVLLGNGDGTLSQAASFSLGAAVRSFLAAGDFDGDRHADLAAGVQVDPLGRLGHVSVLPGDGHGGFGPARDVTASLAPAGLAAADADGDGNLDLVFDTTSAVGVLLSRGGGAFLRAVTPAAEVGAGLGVGDFDGDGQPDLAAGGPGGLTVLAGAGDGTFQGADPGAVAVGQGPAALAAGDFDRDGRVDLVSADTQSNGLSPLAGQGDGTFRAFGPPRPAAAPFGVATGDFDRDGRLDLASVGVESSSAVVSVQIGLGDGTFRAGARLPLPGRGFAVSRGALLAAELNDDNGDGRINARDFLDLVVGEQGEDRVSVLLGNGDGTLRAAGSFQIPLGPTDLAVADFNGDALPDLAVGTPDRLGRVAILYAAAGGTFRAPVLVDTGTPNPGSVAAADLDGDGRADLVVGNQADTDLFGSFSGRITILLSGDGFATPHAGPLGGFDPLSVVLADFTGDGLPDLAFSSNTGGGGALVAVATGDGHGGFGDSALFNTVFTDSPLRSLVAQDVNGDGTLDLAGLDPIAGTVRVLLGVRGRDPEAPGDVSLVPVDRGTGAIQATPLQADLSGDGVQDAVVLRRDGRILLRQGRAGQPGVFEPPVVVNPRPVTPGAPDFPARDVAVVGGPQGTVLAALDARGSAVSLYQRDGATGRFVRSALAVPGGLPVRLAAGDLDGVNGEDLVVAAAGSNQVFVYLRGAGGAFGPAPSYTVSTGVGPSALALADVDGDGLRDVVVTDQGSGDVTVALNGHGNPFATSLRYRAGAGPYGLDQGVVLSREGTVAVTAGHFDVSARPGPGTDLVVLDAGSRAARLLPSSGDGLFNPRLTIGVPLGTRPTAVVVGRFNPDALDDLAVLDRDAGSVRIYLGDGAGGFTPGQSLAVGATPSGLSVADVNGDGHADLLVGNEFGDLLVVPGRGDGTFGRFLRSDRSTPLVVTDLNGDGVPDAIVASQAADRVEAQLRQPGTNRFAAGDVGGGLGGLLVGPGAVKLADLDGINGADLIVANTGSNNVLVALRQADGSFGLPRAYFVGTNPTGLLVQDLNGDGILDLAAANSGSNDVSVLFGRGRGDTWRLDLGPRLDAGNGPIAVQATDQFRRDGSRGADGVPDLLVTNGQDGTVSVLPGIGQTDVSGALRPGESFDDTVPRFLPLPSNAGIVSAVPGFAVTRDGTVLDTATTFAPVFTSDPGRRVEFVEAFTLPGQTSPVLFAGRSDGSVSLLMLGADGDFVEAEVFRDTALTDPSDLQVVSDGGRLELYVTEAGSDVVVVFPFDLGSSPPRDEPGPGDSTPPIPSTGAVTVGEFRLGFIFTLRDVGDLLPAPRSQADAGSEPAAADVVVGVGEGPRALGPAQGGGDGGLPVEEVVAPFVERLRAWVPEGAAAVASTGPGLLAVAAEAARVVAEPLGQALEALGVPELPVADPGLGDAAADIAGALAKAGVTVYSQMMTRFQDGAGRRAGAPSGDEEFAGVPADETAMPPGGSAETEPGGQAAPGDEDPVGAIFEKNHALAALLSSAVFASGFHHAVRRPNPPRNAMKPGRRKRQA